MTIRFGGGEMGAFIPSDSNVYELSSLPLSHNSSFARCGIWIAGLSSYADSFEWAAGDTDVWIHWEPYVQSAGTADGLLFALNSSGTQIFRITAAVNGSGIEYQMQWNNASVWTNIGSSFITSGGRETFDINLNVTASGSATIYSTGTQRATGTANLSALTDVAQIRLDSTNQVYHSQCAVATSSTIGYRLHTAPPTGAGATSDWTGGPTEVDELRYEDGDFVNSATANQVELFTHSATVPSGYKVKAVIVTARAKRGSASGPQNIQLALRSGGTTYFSSSQALGLGYGAHVAVWETDPATAAAFTASAITSLQFGVKSIA